jgi:phospholipase/lecithinase/hemolysin
VNALTNDLVGTQLLQAAVLNNSNSVNRLYTKGARAILIQVDFVESKALGNVVQFGTKTALLSKYGEYITRFNIARFDALNTFSKTKPDLRLLLVDMSSRFDDVLTNSAQYGFTKTDIGALEDTTLTDKSFTGPGADYVFWNSLHVTSMLHKLIAAWNLEKLVAQELFCASFAHSGC